MVKKASAKKKNTPKSKTKISELDQLKQLIETSLEDGKAQNIVIIDLKNKTSIADYIFIASGTSERHVSSLGQNLIQKLKSFGLSNISSEGLNEGNWVLIDSGDIIVHIFKPEIRDFYNLEDMWKETLFS